MKSFRNLAIILSVSVAVFSIILPGIAYALVQYALHAPISAPASLKYQNILKIIGPADPKRPMEGAAPFYSALEVLGLFLEDMNVSFDHVSDWIPLRRKKLIHSQGVVTPIEWQPIPNTLNYTGLFETGSQYGILRASIATPPTIQKEKDTCTEIVPAIALKFFRDGLPSANTIAMYSLNGQQGCNFFEHTLSNHVDAPDGALLKALAKKFHTASEHETKMGVSDLARYTMTKGLPIQHARAPYRLFYEPNPTIRQCLSYYSRPQSPLPWYRQFFYTNQENEPTECFHNQPYLYQVYAQPEPNHTQEQRVHIANLRVPTNNMDMMQSEYGPFFASQVADRHLFFQHVRMESDYQLRPDWA